MLSKKGQRNKSLLELTQLILKLPVPPFTDIRVNTAVKIMAISIIYLLVLCTTIIQFQYNDIIITPILNVWYQALGSTEQLNFCVNSVNYVSCLNITLIDIYSNRGLSYKGGSPTI